MTDPRRGRVVLRRHLLEAGYTDRAIARMVKDGDLVRLRHGAFTDGSTWALLDADGRHALVARAVVAQARTDVVVSHVSGLPFYGAPTWGLDLGAAHVTRRDGKAGRAEAGVVQHCGAVEAGDVTERDGLPVMHPTRLALETTMIAGQEAALCVVSSLLHHGHTSMDALKRRHEAMQLWPGSLGAAVVMRLADPRFESIAECRTYYLCFRHQLPMPEIQHEIRDEAGRVVARVDFAWPELGVFLEFDGKVKYEALLREGESASDVVVAEKRREDLIRRLTGWRCIRITWDDLARPERTAAMIRRVLFPPTRTI